MESIRRVLENMETEEEKKKMHLSAFQSFNAFNNWSKVEVRTRNTTQTAHLGGRNHVLGLSSAVSQAGAGAEVDTIALDLRYCTT